MENLNQNKTLPAEIQTGNLKHINVTVLSVYLLDNNN